MDSVDTPEIPDSPVSLVSPESLAPSVLPDPLDSPVPLEPPECLVQLESPEWTLTIALALREDSPRLEDRPIEEDEGRAFSDKKFIRSIDDKRQCQSQI